MVSACRLACQGVWALFTYFAGGKGLSLYFELRESTGSLGYVEVALLDGKVDEMAAQAVSEVVDVKQKRLASVELGEVLLVSTSI
ncbi:MAG: hypothetical protein R3B54_18680 [Bdellovibrionota bacterium]